MKENKNPFIEEIFFLSSEMHIFFIFIFKICAFLNEFNNFSTILHHSILTFVLKFEFFIFCGIAHNIQSRARQIFLISRSYSENRMLQESILKSKIPI